MGMHENPSSGYVLEASRLSPLFPAEMIKAFEDLIDEREFEEAVEFCKALLPGTVPCPEWFFVLRDEDTGDGEIENDLAYAFFDESDLFEKRPTEQHLELQRLLGIGLERHNWTIFG